MDTLGILNNQLTLYLVLFSLIGITLILLVITIVNTATVSRLKRSYNYFMRGSMTGVSIEELLSALISETRSYAKTQSLLDRRTTALEEHIIRCFQKFAIVRYNPFEDTGGDFSYAIALLDHTDSGIILNGIYNRQGSFTYAKHIQNGEPVKHKLSAEEEEALKIAMSKK